ncbi:MAG: head GIN domain-containing protein [Sphingomicrobium sp.]
MRKSIAAAVMILSATTAGCSHEGRAETITRSFPVGNFSQIEVNGPYDVEVRTGTNPTAVAEGSDKVLDLTDVRIDGDKLVISEKERHGTFSFGWSNRGKVKFVITVPALSAAAITGSGDLKVDHIRGDRFEGTVTGSGDLQLSTVEVQAIKLAITGSGNVTAGSGKARTADYSIAGSGDVDAGGVATEQASVSVAGSGNIKARASGTARVEIAGSGDADISGGAKCSIEKNGSGEVRCS